MKILLIDNYDSFTYNLAQQIERISQRPLTLVKNDHVTPEMARHFDKLVLSPGPGIPKQAGNLMKILKELRYEKPILGVCLGMQAIAESFGGSLRNTKEVFHGISTTATRTPAQSKLLENLPDPIWVGRYHSWVVDPNSLPAELEITSVDPNGTIMSLQHRTYEIHGVQYHPESILTPEGNTIVANFLKI